MTFSSNDFKTKKTDSTKDDDNRMIKKNLNLTFRPYMVLKLNTLAAR